MKRLILSASLVLAVFASVAPAKTPVYRNGALCTKTFTVPMVRRAIDVTYGGTSTVTAPQRARLLRYVRCSRNVNADAYLHHYWHVRRGQWLARRSTPPGWAIPAAIVMCESGGQNLAPNSAGASGYYQIIPSTWQSYGGSRYASEAYLSNKAGQDDIAGRIWAGGSGAGQWVCKA